MKVDCKGCRLCEGRKNIVWGDGSSEAGIMVVGEAPGALEDETGIPFCGASGKLLREALTSCGIHLDSVFITNIVMCRPPGNRDPLDDEVSSCLHWLSEKLLSIQPKLVITVGRYSTALFLSKRSEDIKITKIAGNVYKSSESPFQKCDFYTIPVLHPSYILRRRAVEEANYLISMAKIANFAKEIGAVGTR